MPGIRRRRGICHRPSRAPLCPCRRPLRQPDALQPATAPMSPRRWNDCARRASSVWPSAATTTRHACGRSTAARARSGSMPRWVACATSARMMSLRPELLEINGLRIAVAGLTNNPVAPPGSDPLAQARVDDPKGALAQADAGLLLAARRHRGAEHAQRGRAHRHRRQPRRARSTLQRRRLRPHPPLRA